MISRIYPTIESIIFDMTFEGVNERNAYKLRKAGLWQATELFADEQMRVLSNVILEVECPQDIDSTKELTKADMPWSEIHFQERVSGLPLNPGESYKIWPYNKFNSIDDPYLRGNKFSHTYMERFWPKATKSQGINFFEVGDLNDVVQQLIENPLTRQAYLPVFFPEDTGSIHKQRVPCSLGYLFEDWGGVINCTYNIRSCDIFRHFRNDVYLAMRLMQYVSHRVNAKPGTLTMVINNLHLFQNDIYAFKKKELKLFKDG